MKRIPISCISFTLLGLLLSCGAHSPRVLSPEYQSIHISAVKNNSMQFGIEEPMTNILIDSFLRDGRLRVSDQDDADLEMDSVIQEVTVSPVAFSDLDRAVGYNMRVYMLVSVHDTATGNAIMNQVPFEASGTFLLQNEPTYYRTQDVAMTLSGNIISRLLEGW